MKKDAVKLLERFAFGFGLSMSFFFAIYSVYLKESGLTLLELNMVNFIYMSAVILTDFPTGIFADRYGRKRSVVMGTALLSISFLLYFLSQNFWQFAIAEVVGAIGNTSVNGALEAWVMNSLKSAGKMIDTKTLFQRRALMRQSGVIIGSIAGGFIATYDISYPWIASSTGMLLAGGYAFLFFSEDDFTDEPPKRMSVITHIKRAWKYYIARPQLMQTAAFSAILCASIQAYNMMWPFVFKDKGEIGLSSLGFVFALIPLTIMTGNKFSGIFSLWFKNEKTAMIATQIVTVAGMLSAALIAGFIPLAIGFYVHEIGRGMFEPLKDAFMNRQIDDEKNRASILSLGSTIATAGSAIGLFLSGSIADNFSIQTAWLISGAFLLFFTVAFLAISILIKPADEIENQ